MALPQCTSSRLATKPHDIAKQAFQSLDPWASQRRGQGMVKTIQTTDASAKTAPWNCTTGEDDRSMGALTSNGKEERCSHFCDGRVPGGCLQNVHNRHCESRNAELREHHAEPAQALHMPQGCVYYMQEPA